ncbi:hypothetical protein FB446DRAFT_351972 [Lentinula raphanica]|nr:hypothetical protein FB446DRAFT_351972 [Lentinula raphanica]
MFMQQLSPRLLHTSTIMFSLFLAFLTLTVVASPLGIPVPQNLTERTAHEKSLIYGIDRNQSQRPPQTQTQKPTYTLRLARFDPIKDEWILNTVDFAVNQELYVVFETIAFAPLRWGRQLLHGSISPENSIMLGPGRRTDITLTEDQYTRALHNLWNEGRDFLQYTGGKTSDVEISAAVIRCLRTDCNGLLPKVFENDEDEVAVGIIDTFRKLRAGVESVRKSDCSAMPETEKGEGSSTDVGASARASASASANEASAGVACANAVSGAGAGVGQTVAGVGTGATGARGGGRRTRKTRRKVRFNQILSAYRRAARQH